VVEDDRITPVQPRDQGIGDVGAEALPDRGSIEQGDGGGTAGTRGGRDGRGLGVSVRHGHPATSTARSSAVTAGHLRVRGGLAEGDRPVRIEVGLLFEPVLAGCPHVRPCLLSRADRPFLQVIPRRRKKRHRPLVRVRTPCSAGAQALETCPIGQQAIACGLTPSQQAP
jgi:hypothetical protein